MGIVRLLKNVSTAQSLAQESRFWPQGLCGNALPLLDKQASLRLRPAKAGSAT